MFENWTNITEAVKEIGNQYLPDSAKKYNLSNFLKTITSFLSSQNKQILIMGIEGVGKTQVIYSLDDKTKDKIATKTHIGGGNYDIAIEGQGKGRKKPFVFIDTQGQDSGESLRILESKIHNKEIIGIINVVSYGYLPQRAYAFHNLSNTEVEQKMKEQHKTDLKNEEKVLDEWLRYITKDVKFIITLVNKIDFWHPYAKEIQEHYQNIQDNIVKGKIKDKGLQVHCKTAILPYSAILEPLYIGGQLINPVYQGIHLQNILRDQLKTHILKVLE